MSNKIDYDALSQPLFGFMGQMALGAESDARKLFQRAFPDKSKEFLDFVVNNRIEIYDALKERYKDAYKATEKTKQAEYKQSGKWNSTRPFDFGDALDGLNSEFGKKIYKDIEFFQQKGAVIQLPKEQAQQQEKLDIDPKILSAIKKSQEPQQEQTQSSGSFTSVEREPYTHQQGTIQQPQSVGSLSKIQRTPYTHQQGNIQQQTGSSLTSVQRVPYTRQQGNIQSQEDIPQAVRNSITSIEREPYTNTHGEIQQHPTQSQDFSQRQSLTGIERVAYVAPEVTKKESTFSESLKEGLTTLTQKLQQQFGMTYEQAKDKIKQALGVQQTQTHEKLDDVEPTI